MCPLSSFIGILQVLQVTSVRFQNRTTDSREERRASRSVFNFRCSFPERRDSLPLIRAHCDNMPTQVPSVPNVPEPSLAERARTLALLGHNEDCGLAYPGLPAELEPITAISHPPAHEANGDRCSQRPP